MIGIPFNFTALLSDVPLFLSFVTTFFFFSFFLYTTFRNGRGREVFVTKRVRVLLSGVGRKQPAVG